MTDASDFCNDPYTFMQSNVIIIGLGSDDVENQPLRAETATSVVSGKKCHVYATVKKIDAATTLGCTGASFSLRKAGNDVPEAEKRRIYFLPYSQNAFKGTMLGKWAHYMFTAAMDGCSLGIGSQAGDGHVMVVHANAAQSASGGGGRQQQAKMQKNIMGSIFSTKGQTLTSVISPMDYMVDGTGISTSGPDRIRSTTFGRRIHGNWSFFTLRYRVSGSGLAPTYTHESVHPG